MVQYFGTEGGLLGGATNVQPWLVFMYDFVLREWHVVDRHPRSHARSSLVPMVLSVFMHSNAINPSGHVDVARQVDDIINNVITDIED